MLDPITSTTFHYPIPVSLESCLEAESPKVSIKVSFFIWTAALGKILMIYNLWKRQVVVIDRCCMCKKDGEMINHLFIHCPVARELWNLVISLFGV